jgi:hypothetical protein
MTLFRRLIRSSERRGGRNAEGGHQFLAPVELPFVREEPVDEGLRIMSQQGRSKGGFHDEVNNRRGIEYCSAAVVS